MLQRVVEAAAWIDRQGELNVRVRLGLRMSARRSMADNENDGEDDQ
jgi:hypothetical protein